MAVLWVLEDELGLRLESEGEMGVIGREARLCGGTRLLGRPGGVGVRCDGGNDGRASPSMAPPVVMLLMLPLSVLRVLCPCETVAPLVGSDISSVSSVISI